MRPICLGRPYQERNANATYVFWLTSKWGYQNCYTSLMTSEVVTLPNNRWGCDFRMTCYVSIQHLRDLKATCNIKQLTQRRKATKNVFKLCRWWIVWELLTRWAENKIIHSIIRKVNDYCLLISCYLTIYDALLIAHVKIPNQTLTQLLYWSCLFWWRNTDLLSEVTMWSSFMTPSFYWHTLGSLVPTEHLLNVTVL